jgi:crotonobetainyl-CoA:carnitine CoA-transferase CaiB-like acyl-CoA transferase
MGPLAGIRILDLTRLLPGGFATRLLADLGADVVKVEQPGRGDYMRWEEPRLGPESAHSWVTDRGKSSIAIDLKDPRGVAALERLVGGADALIESFRPGVMDRLDVGYERLRDVNPRLVFCSMSGYGGDGPLASRPGHDINYIGRAGILSITGTRERPTLPGVQVGDLAAGSLMSLVGLLASLLQAKQTGEGEHVDVSITDGAFALLSIHLGVYFVDGVVPTREGMILNGAYPCYNVYECADGLWLTVGALEPKFWAALCDGAGRRDLIETRVESDAVGTWRDVFRERARGEWLELLPEDACVGPVNDFAEAVRDPQLRHRRMVVEQEHPTEGLVRQLGEPIKLRSLPETNATPAPRLGADTRRLLTEAGFSADEIDALVADSVVAVGSA